MNRLPASLRGTGRQATVLLKLHGPECNACAAYVAALEKHADEIAEWDGRVIQTRDVAGQIASVTIADQWGEIAVMEEAADHHFMEPKELITWLRYLAMKCPECEGEAL